MSRHPQHVREGALAAFAAGRPWPEILSTFDVTRDTVKKWARRAGLPMRQHGGAREASFKSTPEIRRAAAIAYRYGESTVEIGHRYGVSPHCVSEWLHRAGVAMRRRRKAQQRSDAQEETP